MDWAPPGGAVASRCRSARTARRGCDRGDDVDARTVTVGGQSTPYWNAGPQYAGYAGGYYNGFGSVLPALLIGTVLGSSLGGGFGMGGFGWGLRRWLGRRWLGGSGDVSGMMAAATSAVVISVAGATSVVAATRGVATSAAAATSAAGTEPPLLEVRHYRSCESHTRSSSWIPSITMGSGYPVAGVNASLSTQSILKPMRW